MLRILAFLLVFGVWGGGWAIPLTNLTDMSGQPAAVNHGKDKELVVFWATWCTECKPHLKKDLPELVKKGEVGVVTINTDTDVERAKNFIQKEGISLTVLRDPSKGLRKELGVFSIPHWAVYKKQGADWKLVKTAAAFDWDQVNQALR